MNEKSRTVNSLRNSAMGVLAQIAGILLNFVGRTFFIKLLNVDYLGVNGLFTNIITILSLAELGVGTAIVYMMYEPIAKGNIKKVAAFNQLFRKLYNIIGLCILFAGLAVIPFLGDIIKEAPNIQEDIRIVYILFIINTSVSYFFTYKRSLLIAHQKEYVNSQNIILFAIIKDIVLIGVLYFWRDYYFYLIAQIIITYLSNLSISRKVNKLYPEIVNAQPESITKHEKKTIIKNTTGMMCHKIGSVIVSGTDNILISAFVGISTVGVFSNYKLIQKVCSQVIGQAVNSVTASVGNLVATSDNNKVYKVFRDLYFINFTMTFFVVVMFYSLMDSFIKIWIGSDYLLPEVCLLIIATNLFLNQIRVPSQVIINTYGIFWNVRWKSIIEAIVNLTSSLILCYIFHLGLVGILMGTIISNLSTCVWWEPYAAYKYGMKKPPLSYYSFFLRDILVFFATILCVHYINYLIVGMLSNTIIIFIVKFLSVLFLSSVLFLVIYGRTDSCKHFIQYISNVIHK